MDPTDNQTAGPADWDVLDRYLAGQLPPDQADQVQHYLDARPGVEPALKRLDGIYAAAQGDEPSLAASWQAMQARIAPVPLRTRQSRPSQRTWWYAAASLAASAAIIIGVWGSGLLQRPLTPTSKTSSYTTGNGQRATVTLSDGTQIQLNVASRLEVPIDYDRGNRTLRLSGEALFTVSHRDRAPFVVIAGPSTTRVLGTTFSVRHYPSDTAAIVAVRDGKVAVQDSVLTAMQQMTVHSATSLSAISSVDSAQFSFAIGRLTLDRIPLASAIAELNRWYDADIRLGDSTLASRRVTGGFHTGSLTDLVAMLEWTFKLRVVRDGRVLTLYSGE